MKIAISVFTLVSFSLAAAGSENLKWEPVGEPNCGGWVTSIQASPHDGQRLLIGGDMLGVGLSTDGAKTWQATVGFTSWEINDSTWHPKDTNVAWFGTLMGPYKSTDGGANWVSISSGLAQKSNPNENLTSRYEAFAVAPSNPDVMYAADTAWDGDKIYATKDGGKSWRVSATGKDVRRALPAGLAGTLMSVDPRDANIAYNAGAEHILATRDGGTTWQDIANQEVTPGAWRGRGYAGWCSTSVRFNPFRRGQVILQGMDAARVLLSDDAMQSWRRPLTEPQPWGGGDDAAFTRDGHIYATTGQGGAFFGIGRSRDGGKTWDLVHGSKHGLPEEGWGKGKNDAGGIFAWPDDPKKVWTCIGGRIFRTTDGGGSWRRVEIGPDITWLAGDLKHTTRLFASGSRNVYLTDDGEKWTPIGGPHRAGRVAVDARGRLLVAAAEGERGGIWRWDEKQPQPWTRLWDDRWAWCVAADPSDAQRLALVCNQNPYTELSSATGVWLSADGGASWSQANDGLAMLRGWTIGFNPFDVEELVVGTQGRGFFKTRWAQGSMPPGERKSYAHTDADTKFAAVTDEPKAKPFQLVIKNGGMTQGDEVPVDWRGKFGEVQVKRDLQTFKVGPASLCVSANGKSGQAFQTIQGGAGAKFTLAGWIKSHGNVKAQAVVQAFADDYKNNQFIQVKFVQGDSDWTQFEKEIELPEWTAFFNVGLLVEGSGQAWLDEVHEASTTVDAVKP